MSELLSHADLCILEVAFLHSFVTRRIIERQLLPGRSKEFTTRVLKRLVDRGFLNRATSPMLVPIGVYLPSRMSCRMMAERTQILSHPKARVRIETFDHDEKVLSVSLTLRKLLNAAWIPERELKQSDYQEVPDGVFLTDQGKAIALEVENSMKGRTRLLQLLSRWERCEIDGVLYVASTQPIHTFLRSCITGTQGRTSLALISLADLSAPGPKLYTPEGEVALQDWIPLR